MLEKMAEFFDSRIDGYEEHMLTCIESAEEFYPFTADCLSGTEGAEVLDLGCGTGLELEYYFPKNPTTKVTGIDLAPGMNDEEFYHYDTPLTVEHETEILRKAGFTSVELLKSWGATYCIRSMK